MLMFSASVVLADGFDEIVNALKSTNAKEVTKFLNSTVELTINDNEGVYSKQQAEIMIKNFLFHLKCSAVYKKTYFLLLLLSIQNMFYIDNNERY